MEKANDKLFASAADKNIQWIINDCICVIWSVLGVGRQDRSTVLENSNAMGKFTNGCMRFTLALALSACETENGPNGLE